MPRSANVLRRWIRRSTLVPLIPVCGLLVVLHGCASTPRVTELDEAMSLYERGRYQDAIDAAGRAEQGGDAIVQQQASYIAGLSAFRLNRLDDAERELLEATRSSDAETSGSAYAMIGTIRMRRGRPRAAADAFTSAADRLEGEEAARARYEAGLAMRAAGDPVGARSQFMSATRESDGAAARDARRELEVTGWTVQVGVFRDRANAERAAGAVSSAVARKALGPVRIVPGRDRSGNRVYLVQVGTFSSRRSASSARQDLGRLDAFVTPVGG